MFKFTVEVIAVVLAVAVLAGSAWLLAEYNESGRCYSDGEISADPLCTKSIAELMADPAKYDGEIVSIIGEFGFPFEGSYIRDVSYEDPIFLSATSEIYSEYSGTCKSVGHLQGVFRKGPIGHLGMSAAGFHATDIIESDTRYRQKCGM